MHHYFARIASIAFVVALSATPTGPASGAVPFEAPGAPQHLSYGGVEFDVPTSWAVVDLAESPTACVRVDVHVAYLGTPGVSSDCPAVALGRTEALLLQPVPSEPPFGTVPLVARSIPDPSPEQLVAGEINGIVNGTGLLVTVTLGAAPAAAMTVLRSLTVAGTAPAKARVDPQATAAQTSAPPSLDRSFTWHYGYGFDACAAPSLDEMRAWLASPYRSIGIYIGGNSRGCVQAHLTASWVRGVATMGWKAQPIYVGVQAPCSGLALKSKMTPGQEWNQGRDSALDAIAQARSLGIGPGSDIYYDMESYPLSPSCSGSVRAFLSSWTSTLHYNGFSSGVYSSAGAGIADLANGSSQPGFVPPDKIWIARWNNTPSVYGHTAFVADSQWSPYGRIHQYVGGHLDTYGGVQLNIDSNVLDTDPNRGSPIGQFDSTSTAASSVTANGWGLDPETASPIIVQMYIDGAANSMNWANRPRPDIAAAFPVNGPNHGYSLSMATVPGWHTACMYAINVGPGFNRSLGCRVVFVPVNSLPTGQLESVTNTASAVTVTGWAVDPDSTSPIAVHAYVDGGAKAAGANLDRPDLAPHFPSSLHGYNVTVPATAGTHRVCVYAINVPGGDNPGLGCRTVTVTNPLPIGQLDTLTTASRSVTVTGWAQDPDSTNPIAVHVYVDSGAKSAIANLDRPDLAPYFPSSLHGYNVTVPATAGAHRVCVYAINVPAGNNPALGCRTVTVL